MSKDAGLRIRIDRELRESFLEACRAADKPAAQVLREFMRGYVKSRRRPAKSNSRTKFKSMVGNSQ